MLFFLYLSSMEVLREIGETLSWFLLLCRLEDVAATGVCGTEVVITADFEESSSNSHDSESSSVTINPIGALLLFMWLGFMMDTGGEELVVIMVSLLVLVDYDIRFVVVMVLLLLFGIDIFVGAIDEEGEEF